MKARTTIGWISMVLLAWTVGCGQGTGQGELVDDPLHEQTRQVIEEMAAGMKAGQFASVEEALQSAVEFLEKQDAIDWAEVQGGEEDPILVARFVNGVHFVMPVSYSVEDCENDPLPVPPLTRSLVNEGFPGTTAVFHDSIGCVDLATLGAELAKQHGYKPPSSIEYGTVEFYRSMAEYPLFYVHAHGGFFQIDGEDFFGLVTEEEQNQEKDDKYMSAGDFRALRIVLAKVVRLNLADFHQHGAVDPADETLYAITQKDVEANCGQFEDHSLVYLDCSSSAKPGGALKMPPMMDALINHNAGAVLGWTGNIERAASNRAGAYLLTRMFGEDFSFEPKNPPLRPFGLTESYDGLQQKGYDVDDITCSYMPWYTPSHAVLVMVPNNYGEMDQRDILLRPSISALSTGSLVDEETLEILGDFGPRQGQVLIGGEPAEIQEWDELEIVVGCDPQTAGPVVVIVDGHESNPVPLSEWNAEFKVSGEVDHRIGLHLDATLHVRFRGDAHASRPGPEDQAKEEYTGLGSIFELDSYSDYEFSREYQDDNYFYEYYSKGRAQMSLEDPLGFTGSCFLMFGEENTLYFTVMLLVEVDVTRTSKSNPDDIMSYKEYKGFAGLFEARLGELGTLLGDTVTLDDGDANLEIEWQDIEPDHAPDCNTPG